MIGHVTLVTAAARLPVTIEEAKAHLFVTHTEDDRRLYLLIRNATDAVQGFAFRQLITATYDYFLDSFPSSRRLPLPLAPLSSVTSIKYQDLNDSQQTFSSGDYQVLTYDDEPGLVELDQDAEWESTYSKADAVVIRFVCGYGADPLKVPEPLRQAILLRVQADYDPLANRSELERAADALLWPLRLAEVG